MSNEHFKKALSNFTHEMGSAPEIRAMFLITRNINKIKNEITFKVNDDRIRQTVMEYLLEKKVLREDFMYHIKNDRINRILSVYEG